MRSADLAARVVLEGEGQTADEYRALLWHEFIADLEVGARLAKRLFLGRFLYSDVTARMIQFMHRSPTFCHIMQDLFAGTQNYLDLKGRLNQNLNGTVREMLMSFYFRQVVPGVEVS